MNRKRSARIAAAVVAFGVVVGTIVGAGSAGAAAWYPQLPKHSGGYKQVSFYETFVAAAPQKQWFFSNQFLPVGGKEPSYFGLQPRPNAADGSTVLAVRFSSFDGAAVPASSLCNNGADGGAGVTCGVDFAASLGHKYELSTTVTSVVRSGVAKTNLTGVVIDTVNGRRTAAGSYDLPAAVTGMPDNWLTWAENYTKIVSGNCTPEGYPYIEVVFSNPTANNGAVTGQAGQITAKNNDNGCAGSNQSTSNASGTTWKSGYKSVTPPTIPPMFGSS